MKNILPANIWLEKAINNELREKEVCLTFDDGMKSQLELAAPMLNDFGLSDTFYLNPNGCEERGGETPS